MASEKNVGADIRISGLGLFTSNPGTAQVARKLGLSRLETDTLEGEVGSLSYEAGELSLDGLQTTLGRGQITADAADVSDLRARTDDGGVFFSVKRIGFPRGMQFSHGELFAPHASIEDAHIVIEDLGQLFARDDQDGDGDDGADDDRERVDLHFLDVLDGQLNIDLAVDMTLPWIGRRRVTHYFRVPIENGTIDYEKLENDVHWLEAAFLTVDMVKDKLVLARDLPLVPYSGKALLRWPLEPEDIPVAKLQRVHLRNLFRWEVPPKGKRSKLVLHALAMKNIELKLDAKAPAQVQLPGGALIQFGDEGQSGLVGLDVQGELRYRSAVDTEPTALHGDIGLLDVTLKDFDIGGASVAVDRLHIGEIDKIELGFDGFRPHRLEIQVSRMAATNLRLRLP